MRPFLVVGCGGSGGVTLQFLMDQLRADLHQREIDRLPEAWQFVHIDVPVVADGVREGLPPVVLDQGGRYVGIATTASNYPDVASVVERQLESERQLGLLATWRADPSRTRVPITKGAGQMRAVGRVVTLSGAKRVQGELEAAFSALSSQAARNQLAEVARLFSPSTAGQVGDAPLVIVVSSMAGGAGASMVLDVCRLLSQLAQYEPESTGLFLYTPEVFTRSLDRSEITGVDGNALATLGELIATQLGAGAGEDLALLRALGLTGRQRPGAPFGRVFPIGATIGDSGALFGDGTLDGIYRGVGRGLAALLLSGTAVNQFVNHELTNNTPRQGTQETLGWGVDPKEIQWGAFGFASLGMGRDRYAEYSAQRLARATVDRLVRGHEQPGDTRPAGEQVASLVEVVFPDFCARAGLPAAGEALSDWYWREVGEKQESQAESLVSSNVDFRLSVSGTVNASQWVDVALHQVNQDSPRLNKAADDASYGWAFEWHRGLMERVERGVEAVVVRHGLAVARSTIERLSGSIDTWVQDLRVAATGTQREVTALPTDVEAGARSLVGTIDARHAVVASLQRGYRDAFSLGLASRNAERAADVLASMRVDLLEPMTRACDEALGLLRVAVESRPSALGLARLATDEYAAWPREGQEVPQRFREAHNEVLLTTADAFPQQFELHMAASVPGGTVGDALPAVVSQVIRNEWPTTGVLPEGRLLTRTATWRPPSLPVDPSSPTAEITTQRRAAYRLAARPAELRTRARAWVARPGEPFSVFVSQSLADYLTGAGVTEAERGVLAQRLVDRFGEALALARPLVGVSQPLVTELHGETAQVLYKFSDVRLRDQVLEARLQRVLQDSGAAATSTAALSAALGAEVDAARIDIFGSYAPLNPAAFSSLLSPLARGWAAANLPEARRAMWQRRRARRLPGCLPMGDKQRRSVVGGWYVARVTGRLRLPDEYPGGRTVEVYDDRRDEWLAFPDPLLVPGEDFRTAGDVMPAVLLSAGLALAQSGAYNSLEPLRPYTLLRRFWDDSDRGLDQHDDVMRYAAAARLRDWLDGERAPRGAPEKQASGNAGGVEDNRMALLKQVVELRDFVATHYLPPGHGTGSGSGDFGVIHRPEDLPRVPLYHEVAPDSHAVLTVLVEILERFGAGSKPGLPGLM